MVRLLHEEDRRLFDGQIAAWATPLRVSPILIETLNRYEIDYIHYGIIMIVNIESGFLTPPFGLNLFVSMAIAKTTLVEVGKAILPFILLFLCCLLTITYVPKISLLLPELLMR